MSRHMPIEQTAMFQRYVAIADKVWEAVHTWPTLAQRTVGHQLIRSADSVGANLVEGDGRYSDADALHFFAIARGSARESRYWIERATHRKLLSHTEAQEMAGELETVTKELNSLINYRRENKNTNIIREAVEPYGMEGERPLGPIPSGPTPNA